MVNLVNAKCPNCGAGLKLNKYDENVKCDYCNNTIIVDDAIACYKLKISGNVSVEGISTNLELIESANELLNMNEYLKAKRKFLEFSEKCPDNYQGWLGLLICRTRNFTIKDNNIMFENDVNKYYEHFMRVAPENVKNQYFETIDRYFDPEKYQRIAEQEKEEKKRKQVDEQKKIATEAKEKRKLERLEDPTYKMMTETANKSKEILLKFGNGLLYFFGGIFILGGLVNNSPFGEKILTILIGLSLFKFIYDFIETKFNISKKHLLIMKIVIPFTLLIIVSSIYPAVNNDNDSNNNTQSTIIEKTNS